ncbi:response regulator [Erythrobacter sp. JK5]|uniref:response regulator n=1 Tax=Erythrobacter sp. JK5 TaxID=2829500 RepID=UPI001BA90640|nr:response regulator [Erythrobacter sp. JK5]QUL38192.1 response regulator [Erythrobacter sp. JK5]
MSGRILVAEDEMIIGIDLCDTVAEAGFSVEGPHSGISSAMLAFQKEKPDLAILDIQLDDGIVFPLAQKLAAENVPIIFHSGRHSRAEVEAHFPTATTLEKPCPPAAMLDAVNEVLAAA